MIGGRDKYLINGHAALQGRVADLFHSVQLNVNNPHFLIMQGRVTKVCLFRSRVCAEGEPCFVYGCVGCGVVGRHHVAMAWRACVRA